MEAKIIQIGNFKGLRISKAILEKYDIRYSVIIKLEENRNIIEPIKKPRSNWDKAFKQMNKLKHDTILIDDVFLEESNWE